MTVTITQKQADFIESFKKEYTKEKYPNTTWQSQAMNSISSLGFGYSMRYANGERASYSDGFDTGDKETLWRAVLDGYEVETKEVVLYKTINISTISSPAKKYYFGKVFDTFAKDFATDFDEVEDKEEIEELVKDGWTVEELD